MTKSYSEQDAATAHPFSNSNGYDHKAWAKRIMHREERRDPDLTSIQVKFARMALDLPDPKTE